MPILEDKVDAFLFFIDHPASPVYSHMWLMVAESSASGQLQEAVIQQLHLQSYRARPGESSAHLLCQCSAFLNLRMVTYTIN